MSYAAQAALAGKHVIDVPIPAEAGGVPDPAALREALAAARAAGQRPGIARADAQRRLTGTVGVRMRRDSPLLWTLIVFIGGSLVFGALRKATEDSSTTVTVLVQFGALAVIIALLVLITRRLS